MPVGTRANAAEATPNIKKEIAITLSGVFQRLHPFINVVMIRLHNAGAYGARYLRAALAHLTGLYACARP